MNLFPEMSILDLVRDFSMSKENEFLCEIKFKGIPHLIEYVLFRKISKVQKSSVLPVPPKIECRNSYDMSEKVTQKNQQSSKELCASCATKNRVQIFT